MPGHVTAGPQAAHDADMKANDARWLARYEDLVRCRERTGRLPRRSVESERGLESWMNEQRRFHRAGTLSADRAEKLGKIPGVLLERRRDRLDELAEFHAAHGRLPRTTAKDPSEARLGKYLVQGLRSSIRQGNISAHRLERARQIPGATDIRVVPDQDAMLEKLHDWVEKHGTMPLNSVSAEPDEVKLAVWAANTSAGDPDAKTPRRRERHLAVQALQASLPAKVPASVGHLDDIERFCAENGHLPRGTGDEKPLNFRLGDLVRLNESGGLDRFTAERLRRVLRYPSWNDYQWEASLKALKSFTAANGALPSNPAHGRIYTWLTVQRRSWRRGSMSDARVEMLAEIPGVLPVETGLAAA